MYNPADAAEGQTRVFVCFEAVVRVVLCTGKDKLADECCSEKLSY